MSSNSTVFDTKYVTFDNDNNVTSFFDGNNFKDPTNAVFSTDLRNDILQKQSTNPFLNGSETVSFADASKILKITEELNTSRNNTESAANLTSSQQQIAGEDDFVEKVKSRNFGNLVYPINADYGTNGQDYLHIEQFEYKPPRSGIFTQDFSSILEGGVERQSAIIKQKIRGSVKLPIPDGISDQNSVNWNGASMGPAATAALNAVSGVADAFGNAINSGTEGGGYDVAKMATSLIDSTGGGAKELAEAAKSPVFGDILRRQLMSAAVTQLGVNVSSEEILAASSGRITNQNLELLFSNMNLRQFSFAFQLVPRSNNESIEIRKILRFFKQGSAPKKSALGSNGSAFFIKSPNVFRMSYKKNGAQIKGLNKFKICACQGVGVNYAPNGYSTYILDSQPVAISLSLGFTELTPIFYDDYEQPDEFLDLKAMTDADNVGF